MSLPRIKSTYLTTILEVSEDLDDQDLKLATKTQGEYCLNRKRNRPPRRHSFGDKGNSSMKYYFVPEPKELLVRTDSFPEYYGTQWTSHGIYKKTLKAGENLSDRRFSQQTKLPDISDTKPRKKDNQILGENCKENQRPMLEKWMQFFG